MTTEQRLKCHAIIHAAATAAAGVGAGLAQIPLSDNLLITPIQIGMVASLGQVFGRTLDETAIKGLISAAAGTITGRNIAQALLGWMPGLGNAINASTAFGVTEAIGWAIASNFEEKAKHEEANEEARRMNVKTQREADNVKRIGIFNALLSLPKLLWDIVFSAFASLFEWALGWLVSIARGICSAVVEPIKLVVSVPRFLWKGICGFGEWADFEDVCRDVVRTVIKTILITGIFTLILLLLIDLNSKYPSLYLELFTRLIGGK